MFFSIIAPVYNAQDYIVRAIDSVLCQKFTDFELILVNDGSQDDTYSILENYAAKDARVKPMHIQNGGVSHARNCGIEQAQGKYVLFLDADDLYKPNALEHIHSLCQTINPDFLTFAYEEYTGEVEDTEAARGQVHFASACTYDSPDEIRRNMLSIISDEMFGAVWSKVYRNEIIQKNHIRMNEKLYLGEDYCFNLEALKYAQTYQIVEDVMYCYMVQNTDSLIKRYKPDKFEQMYRMHRVRSAFIHAESKQSQLRNDINCRMNFIRVCMSCFMDLFRAECPYSFREKLSFVKKHRKIEEDKFHVSYMSCLSSSQKLIYLIFQSRWSFIILLFSKICYYLKFKKAFSTNKVNKA